MRRRLVLAIGGVAAAAVVLFAIPLGVVLARSYRNEDLLRLQRDTVAATRQIDLGAARDPVELPAGPDRLALYDRAGRRVAGHGPPRADPAVRAALRSGRPADRAAGGSLLAAVPILSRERVAGILRAERDDAEAAQDARQAWLLLAVIAAALVGLAALSALVLGRRLAAPLERLGAAARRLGDGDFSVRAPRARIEEVDAVGQALDRTAQRLDALVARERAFTTDASHQLRTPLTALRLELEAMRLDGVPSEPLAAALAQTDRLQATIDTLLAVARDAPRDGAVTDLAVLLDQVEAHWRGPLAAASRPLRIHVPAGGAVAAATPGVVGEILDVLLDNALRHGAGAVAVTVSERGSFLRAQVADEGGGFGAEPDAAFARRVSGTDGHGIGLALARALAQAEGGSLDVAGPGPGAVLSLTLPRATSPTPGP